MSFKPIYRWSCCRFVFRVFFLMKLTVFLIILSVFQSVAVVNAQRINVVANNQTLKNIMGSIQKQQGYTYFFRGANIANISISVDIQDAELPDAMAIILKNQDLSWTLSDKTIVIAPTPKAPLSKTARQQAISGRVIDENSQPVAGATIAVRGDDKKAITDAYGGFEIVTNVADPVLVVTYIGYEPSEVRADTLTGEKIIQLSPSEIILEETVVVGYGTQKKVNLTGSVASVNFEDVANAPIANPTNMLQGRLPGMVLTNNGAQAGKDSPEIRIRGISTLSDNNNPMVLIDGIESDVSQIADIAPHDIENVTVLKDAASASIYGVRAANGVILITTKRGKAQQTQVSYAGNYIVQQPNIMTDYLDAREWATAFNEAKGAEVYTSDMLQKITDGTDPDHFANTYWLDEMFRTAGMHHHHLSVNGGNENSRFMISGQYMDQDGIMLNTGNKRYGFRSNVDSKLGRLNVGLNLSGSKQDIQEPITEVTGEGLMRMITWFTRPTVPVRYSNGHYGYVDGTSLSHTIFKNPIEALHLGNKTFENTRFDGKIFAGIEIVRNLSFQSNLGYKIFRQDISTFSPRTANYNAAGDLLVRNQTNSLYDYNQKSTTLLNENILKYHFEQSAHRLDVLAGHSTQLSRTDLGSAYIQNFPTDNIYEIDAGTLNPAVTGSAYETALQSFFGRINYNYDSKYLLELNVRHDGSSRMPKQHRYGTFPSVSAGWNIDRESFMENVAFISNLKLRGSWGMLGNQEIGNYAFSQALQVGGNYYFGDVLSTGLRKTEIANDKIKWEATRITDIGLDLGLFSNKFTLSFDWFNKQTSDILLRLAMAPSFLGSLSAPYQNAGRVQNKGWELLSTYTDGRNDFKWNVGLNLSAVRNKIIDNGGIDNYGYNTINREGNPINAYYGLVAVGLYRTADDLNRTTNVNGTEKIITQFDTAPELGDIMYLDVNQDGNINDSDRAIIGNPFPKLEYGFNVGLQYKNIGFSMFWQGVGGLDRFNWEQTSISNGGNLTKRWLDRYSSENVNGSMPRLGSPFNDRYSSFWLTNGDYLRLKSLEIGYDLDGSFVQKIGATKVRMFLAGTNLLTFSDIKEYDPEKASWDMRNDVHPNTKTYSFGINLIF